MRNHRLSLIILSLLATAGTAGAIKVWSTGETLTASQLNANFSHIHSLMVGGHGARLVNADVSTSAAIASTKLANGSGIPKYWVSLAYSGAGCGTAVSACTVTGATGVTVTGTGVGLYQVGGIVATVPYGVVLSLKGDGTARICDTVNYAATTVDIVCRTAAGAAVDVGFSLIVMDN
jgi:hypothetical protein